MNEINFDTLEITIDCVKDFITISEQFKDSLTQLSTSPTIYPIDLSHNSSDNLSNLSNKNNNSKNICNKISYLLQSAYKSGLKQKDFIITYGSNYTNQ